jgi:hypothetical protein
MPEPDARSYILDSERGDVTGDGVVDLIYITGRKPDGDTGWFADNITLVIEDGQDGSIRAIKPAYNAGYNARLFLGDFDADGISDIKVSIDAGGSGGYGIYYIYSFKDYIWRQLFDFEAYNNAYPFKVDYKDFFRVSVSSAGLNKLFILDISSKGSDYLSQYYRPDGKLKAPVQGEVLALGALVPVVTDERTNTYDLLGYQRIIGTINAETLGYIENLLYWDGGKFAVKYVAASIQST